MIISEPYANKGVSRYDRHYEAFRCCACDGIILFSADDEALMAMRLEENPIEEAQTAAESGLGYELDYHQFLHYRCGVYLGPGREMSETDLQLISESGTIDNAMAEEICLHYKLSDEQVREIFVRHDAAAADYLEIVEKRGPRDEFSDQFLAMGLAIIQKQICRLGVDDIRKIHAHIYVSKADLRLFTKRNPNNLLVPPRDHPSIINSTDYTPQEFWLMRPICVRCSTVVTLMLPGFSFKQADGRRVFIHDACYREIEDLHHRQELKQMFDFFSSDSQRARLNRIHDVWHYLPMDEYKQWRIAFDASETDAYTSEVGKEQFLSFYETRLHIDPLVEAL